MAEIHAMRQLADAVQGQTKLFGESMAASVRAMEKIGAKMDSLSDEVRQVDRRLLQMEAKEHSAAIDKLNGQIEALKTKIDGLEATRDQQKGALNLVGWLRQTTPWLLAIGAGIAAALGWKDGTP
ncbi:MAG TPA: hypothetical protein VEA44_10610 [Caulobacter sp.]|nr:hypothetical protein [Caulobacter sp.]